MIQTRYFENEKIILHEIQPHLTDSQIDNWLEPHHVAFHRFLVHRPELFVFLGGSFGKPGQQKLFLKEVVNLGYIFINVNYPNSWTIANLCQNNRNPDCYQKTRNAIIYGQKKGRKIIITRANSIENRLVKLILFLANNIQEIPWLNYLNSNNLPKWQSIIVAGHSQGGGHCAIIAKKNLVARVIMLASPVDYHIKSQNHAPWLSSPPITSADRFYGFVHFQDPGYEKIIKAWQLMGLDNYGNLVNVDRTDISRLNSDQLVSNQPPKIKDKFHGGVINDISTPKTADGTPVYRKIWQYLCTHNIPLI